MPDGPPAESRMVETRAGLAPEGDGWFVVNLSDAAAISSERAGYAFLFEGTPAGGGSFPHFGINVHGNTAPGTPNTTGTIGGARWLTPAQAFWNKSSGGAPTIGGFHRVRAAFVAQGSAITVWTGVTIDSAAVKDNVEVNIEFME